MPRERTLPDSQLVVLGRAYEFDGIEDDCGRPDAVRRCLRRRELAKSGRKLIITARGMARIERKPSHAD